MNPTNAATARDGAATSARIKSAIMISARPCGHKTAYGCTLKISIKSYHRGRHWSGSEWRAAVESLSPAAMEGRKGEVVAFPTPAKSGASA
jgi:hypothetical protein